MQDQLQKENKGTSDKNQALLNKITELWADNFSGRQAEELLIDGGAIFSSLIAMHLIALARSNDFFKENVDRAIYAIASIAKEEYDRLSKEEQV